MLYPNSNKQPKRCQAKVIYAEDVIAAGCVVCGGMEFYENITGTRDETKVTSISCKMCFEEYLLRPSTDDIPF